MRTLLLTFLLLTSLSSFAQNNNIYVAQTNGDILVFDKSTKNLENTLSITLPPTPDSVWNAVDVEYNPVNDSLYISGGNAHTVVVMATDGSGQRPLLNTANPSQFPGGTGDCCEHLGLAIDQVGKRIFYQASDHFAVASLDGSGTPSTLYQSPNGEYLVGLDYTPATDKVYFTVLSELEAGVNVINSDGSGRSVLFPGLDYRHLVVDETNGRVYWTDWDNRNVLSGPIAGGTTPDTVVSGLANRPFGIDIDEAAGKLYFTTISGELWVVNTDGSNLEMFAGGIGNSRGVSLGSSSSASVSNAYQQLPVSAYPNPAKDVFTLEFDKKNTEAYILRVFNVNGQNVYKSVLPAGQRSVRETIELKSAPGVYQYVITSQSGERLAAGKVIMN